MYEAIRALEVVGILTWVNRLISVLRPAPHVVWIKVIDVLHAPRLDEGLDRASYDPPGLEVSDREVLEKGVGFD